MKKLYLDDLRVTPEGFDRVYNYADFVEYITQNGLPDFISFDHDLGEVEQSYEKAIHWYTKAAEQGNANAQNNLGVAYHNGNGVEQDKNKAIYWFRKACENFNDDACKNLNRIK